MTREHDELWEAAKPPKPGKIVAYLTVHKNGAVVWKDLPSDDTCVVELRKLPPTVDPNRHEYAIYFKARPPVWWSPHYKTLLNAEVGKQQNQLTDRTKEFVVPS